ncbi:unnamed protein product [Gadus morhua 'NCC']
MASGTMLISPETEAGPGLHRRNYTVSPTILAGLGLSAILCGTAGPLEPSLPLSLAAQPGFGLPSLTWAPLPQRTSLATCVRLGPGLDREQQLPWGELLGVVVEVVVEVVVVVVVLVVLVERGNGRLYVG